MAFDRNKALTGIATKTSGLVAQGHCRSPDAAGRGDFHFVSLCHSASVGFDPYLLIASRIERAHLNYGPVVWATSLIDLSRNALRGIAVNSNSDTRQTDRQGEGKQYDGGDAIEDHLV